MFGAIPIAKRWLGGLASNNRHRDPPVGGGQLAGRVRGFEPNLSPLYCGDKNQAQGLSSSRAPSGIDCLALLQRARS